MIFLTRSFRQWRVVTDLWWLLLAANTVKDYSQIRRLVDLSWSSGPSSWFLYSEVILLQLPSGWIPQNSCLLPPNSPHSHTHTLSYPPTGHNGVTRQSQARIKEIRKEKRQKETEDVDADFIHSHKYTHTHINIYSRSLGAVPERTRISCFTCLCLQLNCWFPAIDREGGRASEAPSRGRPWEHML